MAGGFWDSKWWWVALGGVFVYTAWDEQRQLARAADVLRPHPPSGVAPTTDTWHAGFDPVPSELAWKSALRTTQFQLRALGYDDVPDTGIMDGPTMRALARFNTGHAGYAPLVFPERRADLLPSATAPDATTAAGYRNVARLLDAVNTAFRTQFGG